MTSASARRRGRPPRTARDNLDTRELLIRCGLELLTERGLVATGIGALLKRAEVPRGSFYHYFASKEAFGEAVMMRYADYFADKLDHWLLDPATAPLERLENFMQDAMAGMARHAFRRGCLVGNLGQEVSLLAEPFGERLQAIIADWEWRVADCLQLAQYRGELAAHADCRRLAVLFWIGWEGAVQRARMVQGAAPLTLFAQMYMAQLPR